MLAVLVAIMGCVAKLTKTLSSVSVRRVGKETFVIRRFCFVSKIHVKIMENVSMLLDLILILANVKA